MQHIAAQALSIKTENGHLTGLKYRLDIYSLDWLGHRGGGWAVDPNVLR